MGLNIYTVKTGTKTAKAVWNSAEHSNDPLSGRNPGQGTGSAFSNIRALSGPLAIVDGLVQGDVHFAGGLVFIGPGGKCKGSVKAHRLRIEGEVQGGTVDVDTVIEVLPEGRLSARITHGTVDASPGAILNVVEGPELRPVAPPVRPASGPTTAKPASRLEQRPAPLHVPPPPAPKPVPAAAAAEVAEVAEVAEPASPKAPAAPSPTKVRVAFKGGFKS